MHESLDTWLDVLGNSDRAVGMDMLEKLTLWLSMARRKHEWDPLPIFGNLDQVAALHSEVCELSRAVFWDDPVEHQVSEVLDTLAVGLRLLCGEHLEGKARVQWLDALQKARPTRPGEVSPFDEHKGKHVPLHEVGQSLRRDDLDKWFANTCNKVMGEKSDT